MSDHLATVGAVINMRLECQAKQSLVDNKLSIDKPVQ